MKRALVYAALAATVWLWWHYSGGVKATALPEGGLVYPGYDITPLDDFDLDARVLSRADYRHGREAELAPTDLALGWGPMADDAVLADIDVSQSNRWYFWRSEHLPIPAHEVSTHSANVHVIPANSDVAVALALVGRDAHVHLVGKLVEVRAGDGWHWRSSLSRSDTGAGSCELLWLERLDVL